MLAIGRESAACGRLTGSLRARGSTLSGGKTALRIAATGGRRSSSPMCSDEVAAGEGAFEHVDDAVGSSIRKSSTIVPSGRAAWARTPAGAGIEVLGAISGHEPLQGADERRLAEAPPHFAGADPPVLGGQPQEAGVGERLGQVAEVEVGLACSPRGRRRARRWGRTRRRRRSSRVKWTPRNGNAGSGTG